MSPDDYVFHKELKEISEIMKEIENAGEKESAFNGRRKSDDLHVKLVDKTKSLLDNGFLEGEKRKMKSISSLQIFWMSLVLAILLFFIGLSIGIGYMAIADLEECAYYGNCIRSKNE